MGVAGLGLGAAAWSLRSEPLTRHKLALAAGLGSLVFAAQAINVPVLPGSSAHLVGGVLLAVVLGPGLGALTMGLILLVQALVLGDGGVMALGANVLNMALLPAGLVALGRKPGSSAEGSRSAYLKAGAIAAISVPLAAMLIVGQTALFRSPAELTGWGDFAVRMIGTHLWIGLAEGGLTVLLVAAVARLASPASEGQTNWRPVWISLAAAVLLGVLSACSSSLPDGYEVAAERSGMAWLLAENAGPIGR
jgi:cobalt/nickel transport system permease protein